VSARRGPSTTAVHGPPHRRPHWSPVAPPLIQSTTFVNPIGSDEPILYAGYGNTPTQVALAKKYAALEGAEDAVFVASGMAATALAHLTVLRPGDHLVASRWIYGGTQRLFDEELARFGITVTYVSPDEPRQWRKSVRRETRAVFIESPTNPLMRVVDLVPVLKIVKEFGVALLVDGTFASPVNFRPLEHGADVVITSATKYLNGHNDVIAGAVAGSASFVEEVTRLMRLWGQAIDPFAAWLVDRGSGRWRSGWSGTTPTGSRSLAGPRSRSGSPRCITPASTRIPTTPWQRGCSGASAGWSDSSWRAASMPASGFCPGSSWWSTRPAWAGSRA